MNILFGLYAAIMAALYLLLSFFFELSHIANNIGGTLGDVSTAISTAGSFTVFVGAAGIVLGVFLFVKRKKKAAAFLAAAAGVVYALALLGGMFAVEAIHTEKMEREMDDRMRGMYGDNWDAPSAVDGIPEQYAEILNKFSVITRDAWDAQAIAETDLYAQSLPLYYGGNAADQIGFLLMDVNADGSDELLIGTASATEGGGTTIITAYTDPANPYPFLTSAEGEWYHLHSGEDGLYRVEIGGTAEDGSAHHGTWLLERGTQEDRCGIAYSMEILDASTRLTLDMIPFSFYR